MKKIYVELFDAKSSKSVDVGRDDFDASFLDENSPKIDETPFKKILIEIITAIESMPVVFDLLEKELSLYLICRQDRVIIGWLYQGLNLAYTDSWSLPRSLVYSACVEQYIQKTLSELILCQKKTSKQGRIKE